MIRSGMSDQKSGVVRALLNSKKFIVFTASILTAILVHFVGISEAEAASISDKVVNLATVYLGAQGAADLGLGIGAKSA